MLSELLGINDGTVLVLKCSNPVLMPWIDQAPTILEAWNQGTEDGHVVADVLFGVVNPSGKVPTTYGVSAVTSSTQGTRNAIPARMRVKDTRSSGTPRAWPWGTAGTSPRESSPCSPSDTGCPTARSSCHTLK